MELIYRRRTVVRVALSAGHAVLSPSTRFTVIPSTSCIKGAKTARPTTDTIWRAIRRGEARLKITDTNAFASSLAKCVRLIISARAANHGKSRANLVQALHECHNELYEHEMIHTANMIGQAMKIIENQLGSGSAARL
jgi:hypothetical protein